MPPTPRPTPRATMQDVAARAGASLKTVSRVVNGEPGVAPAMAERIGAAMLELGYRRNVGASNLRRGARTASLGVLLQDVSNAYCAEVLRGIEDRARESGVVVLASSVDEDPDRERDLVDAFVGRRIDGLVIMPSGSPMDYLVAEQRAGLAVVAVDRPSPVASIDSVVVDNREASAAAVRGLVERGHRRIAALIDDPRIPTAPERHAGYRDALREADLAADPDLEMVGARSLEEAAGALTRMLALSDPPTAVFAGRNTICIGAAMALRSAGLSHRVALIGFDEVPYADLLDPPISVIRQDAHRIGTLAADMLLARIDGDDQPARAAVVPTTYVARGSGEIGVP